MAGRRAIPNATSTKSSFARTGVLKKAEGQFLKPVFDILLDNFNGVLTITMNMKQSNKIDK